MMNKSQLSALINKAEKSYDKVNQLHSQYEMARGNFRMKKLEIHESKLKGEMLSDQIRLEEEDDMKMECELARQRLCDSISIARNYTLQAINTLKESDEPEIDMKLLKELQKNLSQLPQCPDESDLNITLDSSMSSLSDEILSSDNDDDDDDDGSDDFDDAAAADLMNLIQEENLSAVNRVIEKSRKLSEIEAELKKIEKLKIQNRNEMFALKDQQLETSHHQQQQRQFFVVMNELKNDYRRTRADIKRMINELLSNVEDANIRRDLFEILRNIDSYDLDKSSPEVQPQVVRKSQIPSRLQQPRNLQTQSRIPQSQLRSNQPQSQIPQPQSRIPQFQPQVPQAQSQIPQFQSRIQQPQSRIPQGQSQYPQFQSKIPQISQLQSQIPLTQSQIPQFQSKISKLPQMQKTRIPSIAENANQYKSKIIEPSNIRQNTNLRQIPRPVNLPQQKSFVSGLKKPQKTVLKLSESRRNLRKIGYRPSIEMQPQTPLKKLLLKQNALKAIDDAQRLFAQIDERPTSAQKDQQQTRSSSRPRSSNVKAKIQSQVNKLQKANLQKSFTESSAKQKLEKFANTFCSIFIRNQKNRRNKFDIWVKTFHDNLNPILNDLDAFYKSMPYPELKKFNRKQVEKSLNRLLFLIYEQTKRFDITNLKCKDLIGNEMAKILERKHLNSLTASMGIFLQGIKELIEPYIEAAESESMRQKLPEVKEKSHVASFLQKSQGKRNQTEESIEVPSFGDDESLLSKMPKKDLQSMYKKIVKGTYQQPITQGTTKQFQALDRIESKMRQRVVDGAKDKKYEGYLQARGQINQQIVLPFYDKIEAAFLPIFKRIMGTGTTSQWKNSQLTEVTLNALNIVLMHCQEVDNAICRVLTQDKNSSAFDDEAVSRALNDLTHEIKGFLYNHDGEKYQREMSDLDKFKQELDPYKLEDYTITNVKCDQLLSDPFSSKDKNFSVEFMKMLRFMEFKYISKILNGEIDDSSNNFNLNITKINQPVRIASNYTEIPKDILERDILYVACQLTRRQLLDDDENDHFDFVSKFAIKVANAFQDDKIDESDAYRILRQIFLRLPCVPINFYQTFIYHADNEYFKTVRVEDSVLNTIVRSQALSALNKQMCATDQTLYRLQHNVIVSTIETFMNAFDNNLNLMVMAFKNAEMRPQSTAHIRGNEVANNGNGILGIPDEINRQTALDGEINNVQLGLISSNIPHANIASDEIGKELGKMNDTLRNQMAINDHLENSKVAKISKKFELQPSALKRKTYWQCRGSEMPKWFPGFYTVFPDSYQSKPISYQEPFKILPHAWRTMAPLVKNY